MNQRPPEQPAGYAPMPGTSYPAVPAPAPGAYPQPYPQTYPQPYAPGYPYYPPYTWAPPPAPKPTPAERASRPGVARVRNLVLAVAIAVVTVGAVALGAAAALTGQDAPAPTAGGLQQVYDSALTPSEAANWALTSGCALENGGLHATAGTDSGVGCEFQPSSKGDLLSQGFYLATSLAPALQVAGEEAEAIDLTMPDGSLVELRFVQDGTYALEQIQTDGTALNTQSGVTIAWHADSYEVNTVVVRYTAATQTLAAYVNGQSVLAENLQIPVQPGASVSLGAPSNGEALITHFTLYCASPASS